MLFTIGLAIFTLMADCGDEADADQSPSLDGISRRGVRSKSHDTTDAFVATNVREFDFGDRQSIGTCSCAIFGMQIW